MVDAGGQRLDVLGVDGREHRDAQLVAAELAVGLDVDDAVGAQHLRDGGRVDVVGEVDRADDLRAVRPGRSTNGVRVGRRAPPSRRAGEELSAVRDDRPVRPPWPFIQSTWSASSARVATRGRVVGLVLARVVDRGRQAEEVGHPPAGRGDLARPGPGRRGRTRPATGRRPRRSTSAARSSRRRPRVRSTGRPPAPDVASTSTSASSSAPADPLRPGHHAGRGLVVRPGVDVDARLGARRRAACPGSALMTVGSARNGAFWVTAGELGGELAEGQVLGALADQAERRDVPERGRPAVAEHDLVAVGQANSSARPSRTRPTRFLTGGLPVRGAEQRRARRRPGLDLLGAHLARARSRSARRRA